MQCVGCGRIPNEEELSSTECGGKLDALESVGGVIVQQAEVAIYLSDEERHIL